MGDGGRPRDCPLRLGGARIQKTETLCEQRHVMQSCFYISFKLFSDYLVISM